MREVVLLRKGDLDVDLASWDSTTSENETGFKTTIIDHVWLRLDFPDWAAPWKVLNVFPNSQWQGQSDWQSHLQSQGIYLQASRGSIDREEWEHRHPGDPSPLSAGMNDYIFATGAVALEQRADPQRKVIIIFACIHGCLTRYVSTEELCHLSIFANEQILEVISDMFLEEACRSAAIALGKRNNERRSTLVPPSNQRTLFENRLEDSTNADAGLVFAVLSDVRTIGNKLVCVLHAFDRRHPQGIVAKLLKKKISVL